MTDQTTLTDEERSLYEWHLWVDGFGEEGQRRLKGARVLVTRVGGVGGALAQQLAVAGIGKVVLAHAGDLRLNDLNRQVLMRHDHIGQSRVLQAAERLRALNPHIDIVPVAENISESNVDRLVGEVDLVASCAPLFSERLLLNRAAVALKKPLVDCAMYELEAQLTTIMPGRGPCLTCLYPSEPHAWRRQFPVFGAVAGTVGSLGAMEAIKLLAGLGEPLVGKMLIADLATMSFRKVQIQRDPNCPVCSGVGRN